MSGKTGSSAGRARSAMRMAEFWKPALMAASLIRRISSSYRVLSPSASRLSRQIFEGPRVDLVEFGLWLRPPPAWPCSSRCSASWNSASTRRTIAGPGGVKGRLDLPAWLARLRYSGCLATVIGL